MNIFIKFIFLTAIGILTPSLCLAASDGPLNLQMTGSKLGIASLVIFVIAYILVMAEEFLHLRKSKPVILAAGIIWVFVAYTANTVNLSHEAETAVRHNLLEYCELFLFLLVAMTYVNAMEERNIFEALRAWLVKKRFTYRKLFWITGILAFFISPIADNLTTALLMCAVVMAVGADKPKFIAVGCVNIVVAANSGGAFSPFGDITTLMVWQKGILPFYEFFQIFLPSLVSFVIPAFFMQFAVPKETPAAVDENVSIHYGGYTVVILFLLTIVTAVSFHNFLHLPPTIGMMTGLAYLQFYGFFLKKTGHTLAHPESLGEVVPFDIFRKIQRAEWDTLLFFYGVVLCVGGLSTFGYLAVASETMYQEWGSSLAAIHQQTPANIVVGVLSAIIDNIPVMFAVLTMNPTMSEGQWLLVTLTAGIGGSLLSIGSAAGVALMGQSKGYYTFFSHLKWAWAIALGYVAGIAVHLWWNKELFSVAIPG
jgi:NhaD family Na+/H+ antiporter